MWYIIAIQLDETLKQRFTDLRALLSRAEEAVNYAVSPENRSPSIKNFKDYFTKVL